MLEAAEKEGLDIACDRYPYTAGWTDLDAVLPPWAFAGGAGKEMERLSDPETRKKLADVLNSQYPSLEDWHEVMVVSTVSPEGKRWEGKRIDEISRETGRRPPEIVFDILLAEKLEVSAVYFSLSQENLRRFLRLPYCLIGSDSSVYVSEALEGKPHPRAFGTFPRLLGHFVREEGLLDLGEAISRMTYLTARRFGLEGRGEIKAGHWADLVIFDPEKIEDRATYEAPMEMPGGIIATIVNGVVAYEKGCSTGAFPGKVLRKRLGEHTPVSSL